MNSDRNKKVVEWIRDRANQGFKKDISLVLVYGSFVNGTANRMSDVDCYFIPKRKNGYQFAKTFIIEEIGYDIFPITWERVEGLAELKEDIIPCLGNAKILFSSSKSDIRHFSILQDKLKRNLSDSEFMRKESCEKYEFSNHLYGKILGQNSLCDIRKYAGLIIISLANAVAFYNQTYYAKGLKKLFEDLEQIENKPIRFTELCVTIIKASDAEIIKGYVLEILENTMMFLKCHISTAIGSQSIESKKTNKTQKANFQKLAELYEEISSIFNKIYVNCRDNDYLQAYVSAVCLQCELDKACNDHGLERYDLLGFYAFDRLSILESKTKEIENELTAKIITGGGNIKKYASFDEFIKAKL